MLKVLMVLGFIAGVVAAAKFNVETGRALPGR